jgi:MoaA/NifB/PqqE/SkfB family radical SAM enzyme
MNPKINDMILLAKYLGVDVGLVSNGIFLDKVMDVCDKLSYVRVSLDCASPDTYFRTKHTNYFNQIVDNVKRLVDSASTHVGLSFVITDENRDEIDAFHSLAKSIGVHYAQVKPEIKDGDMESETEGLDRSKFFVTERYNIDESSTIACKIAGLIGVLNATGTVYYCCIHRGRAKFAIGDLNIHSLLDIYHDIRPKFKPDLRMCGGSCRYMNYAKVYERCRGNRFIPLRHRTFI